MQKAQRKNIAKSIKHLDPLSAISTEKRYNLHIGFLNLLI